MSAVDYVNEETGTQIRIEGHESSLKLTITSFQLGAPMALSVFLPRSAAAANFKQLADMIYANSDLYEDAINQFIQKTQEPS
jgi:hypothetical protein